MTILRIIYMNLFNFMVGTNADKKSTRFFVHTYTTVILMSFLVNVIGVSMYFLGVDVSAYGLNINSFFDFILNLLAGVVAILMIKLFRPFP